ncbi:MAG TPA: hypothetical protein VE988_13975 [Gemmataceae bacterium]|nr:hypothetical protein [Gemmataceae bacterium]
MRNKVLLIAVLTAWNVPALAYADGGTVRASEVRDGRRITVFTSPTFLRAGPLDVSVLVQDAASGKPLLDLPIVVTAYPILDPRRKISAPATTDAATNKLLHAAQLNLPEDGTWRIEVVVKGLEQEPAIGFDVDVAPPPPPWLGMSLWIGWPLLAIGVFACHQWLVHKRRPFSR